jgi:uncharacterized FlaG/YvyC family protein
MEISAIDRILPLTAPESVSRVLDMPREVVAAVQALNRSELFGRDREWAFTRDETSGKVIIQIKDRTSGQVLEQIPPKQLRAIMADLRRNEQLETQA